jgi:hypothetical protein
MRGWRVSLDITQFIVIILIIPEIDIMMHLIYIMMYENNDFAR